LHRSVHTDYLNYQNMRNTYVDTFLDKLVNWDFVEKQLPASAN
jgi:Fe-Mn family superoxide dismutase